VDVLFGPRVFRFGVIVFALIFILQLVIIYIPENAEAIGEPTVIVSFDQAEQIAIVGPNSSGIVTFTGMVYCYLPVDCGETTVLVSLEANASGWNCTVNPTVLIFERRITQHCFSVSVRVPPGTSARFSRQLTVGGKAINVPGELKTEVPPATAIINIRQYYKFSVECDEPYKEISPGEECIFTIKFTNKGNDQDVIRLSIDPESDKRLDEKGWAVMVSCTEYIIDEGQQIEVKLTVIPPQDWTLYVHELTPIKLKFYSFQAYTLGGGPIERTLDLYVHEKGGFPFDDPKCYIVSFFLFSIILLIAFVFIRILKSKRPRRRIKPPHNVK
jgi:hypothetical protein